MVVVHDIKEVEDEKQKEVQKKLKNEELLSLHIPSIAVDRRHL